MRTHVPVLIAEVLNIFQPKSANILLDATVGQGGHAKSYLEASAPLGKVIGIDADRKVLETAREHLAQFGERVILVNNNFANLKDSVLGGGILSPDMSGESQLVNEGSRDSIPPLFNHILFDLGVGSHQLGDTERGFTFASEGGLSMMYGNNVLPPSQIAALNMLERRLGRLPDVADIIAYLTAEDIAEIIHIFGEERYSRRIGRAIKKAPVKPSTGLALAEIITNAIPGSRSHGRINSATRSFQALRIAVNRELEALARALPQAVDLLAPGGVMIVISFHSLEDRIVKHFFRSEKKLQILTKKPWQAKDDEKSRNPGSRSAKLRAASKV